MARRAAGGLGPAAAGGKASRVVLPGVSRVPGAPDGARSEELTRLVMAAQPVATEDYQVASLREAAVADEATFLDTEAVRAQVNSPTYLAGLWDKEGSAGVQPARLAWGLADACERIGVRIAERTPATGLASDEDGVTVRTRGGVLRARRVALGTNAFPPLVRRLRPYIVPVYDYVLVTEPLSPAQLAAIGWQNRQGVGDAGNQFHYYRLTSDNRILWGGAGRRVRADRHPDRGADPGHRPGQRRGRRDRAHPKLAGHFFSTFPQLEGIGFSHRWGGAIDTCSRFCAFFGTAHRGRVAYALGYTGLGVAATRFGARVMLDLLSGQPTELTQLEMVRSKPVPFPPEPLAYLGVQATRWSLARADRRSGRRNVWLRALDAARIGYDS